MSQIKRSFQNIRWNPTYAALVLLGLIIAPLFVLPHLRVNNSHWTYYVPDNPPTKYEFKIREIFGQDQLLIGLFEGDVISKPFLHKLGGFVAELQKNPLVDRVLTITTIDHIENDAGGFKVSKLVNADKLDDTSIEEIKKRITANRFASGAAVSKDLEAIAVAVRPQDITTSHSNTELSNSFMAAAKKHDILKNLTAVAGDVELDKAQFATIYDVNVKFVPLTVLVGFLLIWYMFHSWIALALSGVAIAAVVAPSVSLFVLFDQPYNAISGAIPPLLTALTVSLLIHLFNAVTHAYQRGYRGKDLINCGIKDVHRAALYTSITTAAGLLSLLLSPIYPIKYFGVPAAFGVFLLFFIVMYLIPPLLLKFHPGQWPSGKQGIGIFTNVISTMSKLSLRHPVAVIAIIGGSLLVGSFIIKNVVVETNLLKFFDDDHPLPHATERIAEKLSGTSQLALVFEANDPSSLKKPEFLKKQQAIQVWLEAQPEVDRTQSLADFVEEMHWAFSGVADAPKVIPDDEEMVDQLLFVYDGDDLYDIANREITITQLPMNLNVHGSSRIRDVITRIDAYLKKQDFEGVRWQIASTGRMLIEQEQLLVEGQIKSLFGSAVLIFLFLLLLWRSLKDAAIGVIPNLAPVIVMFIVMVLLGISLDTATACIASFLVGIAVDDTIHIYQGFREAKARGTRTSWALMRTFQKSGRAVTATTIVLCAQFLILTGADFVPMAEFGLLSAAGLASALVLDLLFLPSVLIIVYGSKTTDR